ncbi:MAG: hypothetical protein C0483_23470 [Pirellula sp.]|nr:hypothetical protein [Pirellula sp.]
MPQIDLSAFAIGRYSSGPQFCKVRTQRKEAKMSNLNVYGWIRDNVRRAVLLGFSDAVDQIGAVEGNQNINPHLLSMLKQNPAAGAVATESSRAGVAVADEPAAAKPRRRLGRSLDDIRGDKS